MMMIPILILSYKSGYIPYMGIVNVSRKPVHILSHAPSPPDAFAIKFTEMFRPSYEYQQYQRLAHANTTPYMHL